MQVTGVWTAREKVSHPGWITRESGINSPHPHCTDEDPFWLFAERKMVVNFVRGRRERMDSASLATSLRDHWQTALTSDCDNLASG